MKYFWDNQIYVFDDILPLNEQEAIKAHLLGSKFPWQFVPDVTGGGSSDARPAMMHNFIDKGKPSTHVSHMDVVNKVLGAALEKLFVQTGKKSNWSIYNSRSFLQLPLNNLKGHEYDSHHIDWIAPHLSVLYYVCDADGETVIFNNLYSKESPNVPNIPELTEKQRVAPKQGRVVIFDGYHWHTATQPKNGLRCVINTDISQTS